MIRLVSALASLALLTVADSGLFAQDGTGQQEIVLVGAGDIAQCFSRPAVEARAAKTAALIDQIPGTVFVAGDLAYEGGNAEEFENCYGPTWGRFKARTLPVPGNIEYQSRNAAPYFAYWGTAAGEPGQGYYSVKLGSWRVIALNSNVDTRGGSEQVRWLRNELKANPARCTLAFWHHPLISSGWTGDNAHVRSLFEALYGAGADVVINGHDHVYERFAPHDPQGQADPAHGIRVFIVGTGGATSVPFARVRASSEVRKSDVYGVLRLRLRADSYAWEFVPIEGQTFRDSGEGKCHG